MTVDLLRSAGVVPIVDAPDGLDEVRLADTLTEAGLSCIEITLRTDAGMEAIRSIRKHRPAVSVVAGTVRTVEQVEAALDADVSLLVTPGFAPEVVDRALSIGARILPGVCTPSEVEMGIARGMDTFKFFPAEAAGGTTFLRALSGPYPDIMFVPTGGISPSNLEAYLSLSNVLACAGSWMVTHKLLRDRDFAGIAERARDAVAIVRRTRASVLPVP